MQETVRYRDGIQFDRSSGETVVADANRPTGDVNVLTHAHGDHLFREAPDEVVCSPLTADLARARREDAAFSVAGHPAIDLLPSGHVAGSTAALVTDEATGERLLYTGDVSTRDRDYLTGFDPVPADALVVETTYGKPEYVFPEQSALEAEIVDWLDDTDAPVLLFGYSLGRAQKLQSLVGRSDRSRLFVTRAVARINEVVEAHLDVDFGAQRYTEDVELGPGDALVLPTQTNNLRFVDHIARNTGAVKAGFSGWAVEESFRYRGDYDETFVLSDHCDFRELVDLVRAVDPEVVYTHHGFADEFATHLAREGYTSRTLKRNQTSLGDF
ncbi:mRNA 3'-end processing factor [Halomarina litorea]|uniref:mRNA 3'-end processing factor n=1 Tax=Halomarina litorea TaxID=2961595 RepID=UPI0020C56C6E|nr:mRNA 3'-end processing factor [Halomarina sp. BCD28]